MSLSEIQATTWEYRAKKPSDLIADNIPMLGLMRKQGQIKTVAGGRVMQCNIRYAQNAYVQYVDASEEFTPGYNKTLDGFEYSPKIILVPVIMNELEKAQNQGDAQFLDLLEERNQIADDSMMNVIESSLQGDGTGYAGKAFAGIKSYIVDSVTGGTMGGLARSSYTAIRNTSINMPSTFTGATDSSNIESRFRNVKNRIVRQKDAADFGLLGQTYYNAACDAASAKQRITSNPVMAELGFDHVVIEGITCVLSGGKSFSGLTKIADDRAYLFPIKAFELRMYKGYNFQPLPKRVSFNQLVDVSLTVGIGQFISSGTALAAVAYDS